MGKDETLWVRGPHTEGKHLVLRNYLDGWLPILGSWNGRETTVMTVRPVSAFIVAATIKDQPYLMSARTLEKSRIALIPSEDVREAFSVDPVFARAVVTELASGYRGAIKSLKNLKLRSGNERLANYLLQLRGDGPDTFELTLEKRRLASLLGMSPENLSRAFNSLRAYGVKVEGPMITLGDVRALTRLARPQALIDDPGY